MAEVKLFQGLITDIGISKAIDTQSVGGWYIAPFKFVLSETKGEFATNRTTTRPSWHEGYFSAINKIGTNRVQLTISLDGDEDTIQRQIQEICVVCKTPSGEEFLYAVVQPLMPLTFTPTVAEEFNFLLTLTNTKGQDVYHIDYIDDTKLNSYQLITEKGQPNGYCPLGANGIVSDNYLPNRDNLPIGSIVPILCTADYIPKGYLPCDGAEYTYTQFKSVYEDYLLGGLLPTCNYVEYQNSIATYGSCGKFGLDTQNAKFKVPYIKDGTSLQQALTNNEIAKLYNAGLPDHTHVFNNYINSRVQLGNDNGVSYGFQYGDSNGYVKGVTKPNDIYGASSTVQPVAISIRWFVLAVHGLVTESRFTDEDWTEWVTQLNKNTLDIAKVNSLVLPYTMIGQPIIYLSDTLPTNYIRLEGAEVSRTTYAKLFEIYSTTYGGGDGSTTFKLPDFRNRTLWGASTLGYVEAGLPNITGTVSINPGTVSWTNGAFTGTNSGQKGHFTEIDYGNRDFNFNASYSNPIYGKSETVQPPSVKVRIITRYQ